MSYKCESGALCPVDPEMLDACCAFCVSISACTYACDDAVGADITNPDFCAFVEESA